MISRNPLIWTHPHSRSKANQHSRCQFLKAEIRDTGELNTLADKVTFPGSLGRCHKIVAASVSVVTPKIWPYGYHITTALLSVAPSLGQPVEEIY